MLTAYLVCLIVGGVFVGLSVIAGLGKDTDVDKDLGGKDFDKDLGGKDFDKDLGGKDFDAGLDDIDDLDELGHGHHGDHALAHDAPLSDAALAGRPGQQRPQQRRRWRFPKGRVWVPFTSLRFWTFGSCFFGLTGVALTQLTNVGEPTALLSSLALGVFAGTGTAYLMRRLRAPVGAVGHARSWVGQVGELLHPLAENQTSKVRLRVPGRPARELLAVLQPKDRRALPRDTRVVVLDLVDGKAIVEAADPTMYSTLFAADSQPATLEEPDPDEEVV